MKRRDFLKIFGVGLVASLATRTTKARVCERNNAFLDRVYPVGSIYISIDSNNPRSRLGGNWEPFGAGRTLVGVGTSDRVFSANETGGRSREPLTPEQMPRHNHSIVIHAQGTGGTTNFTVARGTDLTLGSTQTSNRGEDEEHDNLQPYITVFMWRRV